MINRMILCEDPSAVLGYVNGEAAFQLNFPYDDDEASSGWITSGELISPSAARRLVLALQSLLAEI